MRNKQNVMITGAVIVLLAVLGLAAAKYAQAATKQIKLTWDAPTERVNGAALRANEIKGYNLYKKNASGQLVKLRTLGVDPRQHIVQEMAGGEYCFALTTLTTDNLESEKSKEVCVNIGAPAASVVLTIELM